jgi:hypothetical protein
LKRKLVFARVWEFSGISTAHEVRQRIESILMGVVCVALGCSDSVSHLARIGVGGAFDSEEFRRE